MMRTLSTVFPQVLQSKTIIYLLPLRNSSIPIPPVYFFSFSSTHTAFTTRPRVVKKVIVSVHKNMSKSVHKKL